MQHTLTTRGRLRGMMIVLAMVWPPFSRTVTAASFVHPVHGFTLWYPEHWYLQPFLPEYGSFVILDTPLDDPRFGGGRDPAPEGTAGIRLEVQESNDPSRKTLEEKTRYGTQFLKWEEKTLGGRVWLTVRQPDLIATTHWACWANSGQQFLFFLTVAPPHPRYKELVATWEKMIASLQLPAPASATQPPPTP